MTADSPPLDPAGWPWLRAALLERSESIQATFRSGHDSATPISKLGWTAGELGAHMVSVPRIYRRLVTEPDDFEIPVSMGEFGERELAAVGTTDLAELAGLMDIAVKELLQVLGGDDDGGDRPVRFYTMTHTAYGVAAIALSELQLHHRDLAAVTGEDVVISDDHVRASLHGMMPASTIFYDAAVARTCPGVYHVHVRNVDDWTIEVAAGQVEVRLGRPERADVRISGAALPFVLTAFGRELPIRPVLRGQLFAYGRRLWKLIPLRRLFVEELSLSTSAHPTP